MADRGKIMLIPSFLAGLFVHLLSPGGGGQKVSDAITRETAFFVNFSGFLLANVSLHFRGYITGSLFGRCLTSPDIACIYGRMWTGLF